MYGIYGEHTQEACPLYNEQNRRWLLENIPNEEKTAQMHGVKNLTTISFSLRAHIFVGC